MTVMCTAPAYRWRFHECVTQCWPAGVWGGLPREVKIDDLSQHQLHNLCVA